MAGLCPAAPDDELQLIKRIKARNTDALEELYNLYKRLLFGLVLAIVKKRKEAKDLLRNIVVKYGIKEIRWMKSAAIPTSNILLSTVKTRTRQEIIKLKHILEEYIG